MPELLQEPHEALSHAAVELVAVAVAPACTPLLLRPEPVVLTLELQHLPAIGDRQRIILLLALLIVTVIEVASGPFIVV